jgi:hypothetical protein
VHFDDVHHRLVTASDYLIRGAQPEEVLAFLMDTQSRVCSKYNAQPSDIRRERLQIVNGHHAVIFEEKSITSNLISNRTFLSRLVAKKLSNAPPTYVFCMMPLATHPKIGTADEHKRIRGELMRVCRLSLVSPDVTLMEHAATIDFKGYVPQWVTQNVAVPLAMEFGCTRHPKSYRCAFGSGVGDGIIAGGSVAVAVGVEGTCIPIVFVQGMFKYTSNR